MLDKIFKISGFLPDCSRAVRHLGITSFHISKVVIPKRQTVREECDRKARDLVYIIKHEGFYSSRKEMVRRTRLDGFISPEKGILHW